MQKCICYVLFSLAALFAVSSEIIGTYGQSDERPDSFVNCVYPIDGLPCEGLDDGVYDICGGCTQGFFAQCQGKELIMIKPCPVKTDENGKIMRLIFDSDKRECVVNSSTCTKES